MKPFVKAFFDEATKTISHLVCKGTGSTRAIIDPVRAFDYACGRIRTRSLGDTIACVESKGPKDV